MATKNTAKINSTRYHDRKIHKGNGGTIMKLFKVVTKNVNKFNVISESWDKAVEAVADNYNEEVVSVELVDEEEKNLIIINEKN